jgi:RND superfamily putative drug exporter
VAAARSAGVTVSYGGALGEAARPSPKDIRSELIGIAVAIVVLLIGFGSLYAAALPILSAAAGTAAALGVLGMVAATFAFPTVSPTLAVMMGLGVGIDYALFLTTRHRQHVIDGADPADAAAGTVATSGRAVLIAAFTVIIAMLGLCASGVGFIGSLGVAAGIAVAIASFSALTLAPALLGLAGRNIDRVHLRRTAAESLLRRQRLAAVYHRCSASARRSRSSPTCR